MNLDGAWSLDFLMNVRSLRGKIDFEDLRGLNKLLPTKYEASANDQQDVSYELYWDYPAYSDPQIQVASPYISWTDYWILKPGSKIKIMGEELPLRMAVLHGSTASLYYEAQAKNLTGDMTKIEALSTDKSLSQNEFFFGFSKRGEEKNPNDILQTMGENFQPIMGNA